MLRTYLRIYVLGSLFLAGGCWSETGQKNSPVLDENARPSRPDTAGLRSHPHDSVPGHPPARSADTLLPEIALEGRARGGALPLDKF